MTQVVKVKAPTTVVNGGGINFNLWLSTLRKIKATNFTKDIEQTRDWIKKLENEYEKAERPKIKFDEYDELIVKSGVFSEVTLPQDRQTLLALNAEVREVIKRFERDAELLEEANEFIMKELKKIGDSKARTDQVSGALSFLKRVSHVHHGLMSVPLMTHAALSRAAASLRGK